MKDFYIRPFLPEAEAKYKILEVLTTTERRDDFLWFNVSVRPMYDLAEICAVRDKANRRSRLIVWKCPGGLRYGTSDYLEGEWSCPKCRGMSTIYCGGDRSVPWSAVVQYASTFKETDPSPGSAADKKAEERKNQGSSADDVRLKSLCRKDGDTTVTHISQVQTNTSGGRNPEAAPKTNTKPEVESGDISLLVPNLTSFVQEQWAKARNDPGRTLQRHDFELMLKAMAQLAIQPIANFPAEATKSETESAAGAVAGMASMLGQSIAQGSRLKIVSTTCGWLRVHTGTIGMFLVGRTGPNEFRVWSDG